MSIKIRNIIFRIEIFKEGDTIVSLCPELNISSFGDTIDNAKKVPVTHIRTNMTKAGMSRERFF